MPSSVVNFSQQQRLAAFQPKTFNETSRTMDVVFSTGARVMRNSFFDGPFIEELDMDEKSIRLERFNAGAPVLDSHNRYSLDAILGVVENARIEGGKGIATIRFSERESVQPIITDIRAGVIKNLSVGYISHEIREDKEKDGVRVFRAIDWEPTEVSFVTVPADAGAQVRSENESERSCDCKIEYLNDEPTNTENTNPAPSEATRISEENNNQEPEGKVMPLSKEELEKVRLEGASAERQRSADIRDVVTKAKLSEEFQTRMIDEGHPIEKVRELAFEELASQDERTHTDSTNNVQVGEDNTRLYAKQGIEAAILNRFDSKNELDDNSKRFANMQMADLAGASLRAAGVNIDGMNKHQVVKMSLRAPGYQSSSDFPLILENVINKSLQKGYIEAPRTWEPMTTSTTVSDFKQVSRPHLGEFSQLEEVLEGGEYKHGKLGERAEKFSISKYGKMTAVTWEMLVNDDMSAFTRIPAKMGKKARDLESDKVWGLITSNAQVMAETGLNLFDAGHANLNEGGAGAVSETTLAAKREAMRLHQDLDGSSPLNLFPSYIFVPAAREVEATKQLSSITPNQASDVNVFGQNAGFFLRMAVEPRLDQIANSPWLVTADTMQCEMIEVARLAGEESPMVDSRDGFDVDGIEYKIRHLFVAHALDYRGFQYNEGA